MSLHRWKITDLAWSELRALSNEGVGITPQDVLDVQALSLDALDADDDEEALSGGTPVLVGGRWLYPLTVAADCFVAAVEPLARSAEMSAHVFAYAMAHGRDEARMRERGRRALEAVREFARGLTCSFARELEAVSTPYASLPPAVEDPRAEEVDASAAELARAAFAQIGGDLRAYEFQMSVGTVVALLRQHARLCAAAGTDAQTSPRIDALRRLGLRVEEIRKRKGAA